MNKPMVGAFVVLGILIAAGGGYWFGQQGIVTPGGGGAASAGAGAAAKGAPAASPAGDIVVEAVKVETLSLPQTITAVGSLRSDESVTLLAAGYDYDSHWTVLSMGLSPFGMTASVAAP